MGFLFAAVAPIIACAPTFLFQARKLKSLNPKYGSIWSGDIRRYPADTQPQSRRQCDQKSLVAPLLFVCIVRAISFSSLWNTHCPRSSLPRYGACTVMLKPRSELGSCRDVFHRTTEVPRNCLTISDCCCHSDGLYRPTARSLCAMTALGTGSVPAQNWKAEPG